MNWRLIIDGAATGAWNMAVDEAMLRAHAAAATPPTIRFYDWQPACISLGRFQKYSELSHHHSPLTTHHSLDIVRRPTGGRAVLHQHEITYSAVIREELLPPASTSVVGAYRWLSGGFLAGLRELGIEAALARVEARKRGVQAPGNCFESAARCDFLVDERKLIGAAQSRKKGAILQHGSLLLQIDEPLWQAALGGSMQSSISLRELGLEASRATIIAALVRGLEYGLQTTLTTGSLGAVERSLAERLRVEKYATAAWNQKAIEPPPEVLLQVLPEVLS